MEEGEFKSNFDITNINDSMELPNNIIIGRLKKDGYICSLEIRGEARVKYNGETYRNPKDFPPGLKQMFHDNTAYNNDAVYVSMNNWFEILLWTYRLVRGGYEEWIWTGKSDIIDAGGSTSEEIRRMLDDYIQKNKLN